MRLRRRPDGQHSSEATGAGGASRSRDEDGFAGGAEGLIFGMLIFVVGTLLVGNAWAVVDTKMATDAASREAVRTYVESPDAADASTRALAAAHSALAGYGRSPERSTVAISGAAWGRCVRVTITVSYAAPLVQLPMLGTPGSAETVRAAHSEVIDPYRSGLAGTAQCG